MLTGALISMLDKAQNPRAVRALDWALRKSTGFDAVDWYQRNGYHGLAAAYRGTGATWAGQSITMDSALEISALFSGVKIIGEDLGALPFHTYQRSGGQIDKAFAHPLYRCLHDLVNPEVSSGEFVESLTGHALLTGAGYAKIDRMQSGTFLWPWQPGDVRTDRNVAGALYYIHREGRGPEKTYTREQVFHLKGFTLDTVTGESLLQRGRQVLGISRAVEKYAGTYFANDATPGVVLSFPTAAPRMGPEVVQAVKDAWIKWHRGNPHEPAVLQGGAEAKRVAASNVESQLLEARKHQIIEACMLLRIPPHKLAQLDRSTNNNIEHQGIEYVVNCIGPWIDRWRRAVYRCLLTFDEQRAGMIWSEMDVAGLLRGDFATQTEGFRKLLEKGVYSINEVRRWLNLNPIPGGDEHFVQLNMGTVQEIAAGMNLPNAMVPVKALTPELRAAMAEIKAAMGMLPVQ